MKIQDLSKNQVRRRTDFVNFLEGLGWKKTKVHRDFESGEDYYVDAQLSRKAANISTISLIQEYDQILFEAEFDTFILRLSTDDRDISNSSAVVEGIPHLSNTDDIEDFLKGLLSSNTKYTIGIGDDFEALSNKSIQEYIQLIQ